MPDQSPDLNWLERAGVRLLTHASDTWPEPSDPIDVLTVEEQRELRRITWRAVFNAGLAGSLSALVSIAASKWSHHQHYHSVKQWSFVILTTLIASAAEFAFLYWDGLRAVRAMAKAAGLRVHSGTLLDADVAVALARAALEIPSPPHNRLGVDPHRDAAKWQLLLVSLVYKGKVALSNVLAKALLRRWLGPVATRAWLAWLALPVTGFWNAVVAHELLWQARIRVMGPSAARDLARWICDGAEPSHCALQAIGAAIVQNREAHPNVLILAHTLFGDLDSQAKDWGDWRGFLRELALAPPHEREQALRATIATAVLDGRVTRREWQWLRQVYIALGVDLDADGVKALRNCFVSGRGVASQLGLPTA